MIPRKVVVVGAGGIGTHFVPVAVKLMRYCGEGDRGLPMLLIDGDVYEEKNRDRQLFPDRMIGTNKAVTQAAFYGYDAIMPLPEYLDTADQFAGFCVRDTDEWDRDADFLLACLCVDNDATRRMVYDGLRDTGLNFIVIDMANEEYTGDVVCCGRMGGELVGPWPPDIYPNLINPGDRPPQAYCQDRAPDSPQIVTANMQAAQIGAEIMRKILRNQPVPVKVTFDMRHMKLWSIWE